MADLGTGSHWLVSPDAEAEKQWIKIAINERVSRIKATELMLEDLQNIQAEKLKHSLMRLRMDLQSLENERDGVNGKVVDAEIVKEG